MTVYTPILKLTVPAFDETPWDQEINNDLYVIDAAVGKFFGVANLVGVWANSTAYSPGQVTIDNSDGSMWTCVTAHTSAATPATFSSDRATNPTFWVQAASTAQDYATQAQTFASNALTSANNAAASATAAAGSASVVAGALPLSGGSMTGALILNADPTGALGAATKQYVDARVGGVGFLPTTGGTMTGPITLSGNPVSALQAAPKQYVDSFLSLSGGTLTGGLTVNAAAGYALSGIAGMSLAANSTVVNLSFATNWRLSYTRSSGALAYLSPTATLLTIDPSGNVSAAGRVTGTGGVFAGPNVALNYSGSTGFLYFNVSDHDYFQWSPGPGSALYWVTGGITAFTWRTSDWLSYNGQGAVGGVGAYVNLSDDRAKHDISFLEIGMVELNKIVPIRFVRDGKERQEIGFSAQNVQEIVPEAVSIFTDDLLAVSSEAVLAITVNAVKELEQRLDELEQYIQWR